MSGTVESRARTGETVGASRGEEILAQIRAHKLRWVELFYTDILGSYNHIHLPVDAVEPEAFVSGIPKLDGSSVRGFKEIYESDMVLLPDPATFATVPWGSNGSGTARFICDILEGGTREPYSRDPRGIARRTVEVLESAGYDRSFWGPEVEFFVFDQVKLLPSADAVRDAWGGAGYAISSAESPWAEPDGHTSIRFKDGYHRTAPGDQLHDLRSEM